MLMMCGALLAGILRRRVGGCTVIRVVIVIVFGVRRVVRWLVIMRLVLMSVLRGWVIAESKRLEFS